MVHLQNQPFRKESDLNQTSMIMFQSLIFRGVIGAKCQPPIWFHAKPGDPLGFATEIPRTKVPFTLNIRQNKSKQMGKNLFMFYGYYCMTLPDYVVSWV